MGYLQQAQLLITGVLPTNAELLNGTIGSEIESYTGAFILGIWEDDAEVLILNMTANGDTYEDKDANMEYYRNMLFEQDCIMYLYGTGGMVSEVDKLQAFEIYTGFRANLLHFSSQTTEYYEQHNNDRYAYQEDGFVSDGD